MKILCTLLSLASIVLLAGCGSGGSGSDSPPPPPPPFRPSLDAFHMVDSYGVSSEDNSQILLALNPYLDDGLFEIYWFANNIDDYTIEIRINDRPTINGSRFVSSDYCGIGLECDLEGIQFCQYYSDFSMSCDPPGTQNPNQYVTYFDDLIHTLPQSLYLIVDLCDTQSNYCEYRVREVSME